MEVFSLGGLQIDSTLYVVNGDLETSGDLIIGAVFHGSNGKAIIGGNLIIDSGAILQVSDQFLLAVNGCAVLAGELSIGGAFTSNQQVYLMNYGCRNGSFANVFLSDANKCVTAIPQYLQNTLVVNINTDGCTHNSPTFFFTTQIIEIIASVGGVTLIAFVIGLVVFIVKKRRDTAIESSFG